jgi:hypothetical protein
MKINNVHVFKTEQNLIKILLLSDLHWDNPKCNRALLKNHMDQAVAGGHDILINGDMFCAMQGKYDGRKNKSDIRPEHNDGNYLDLLVNTAVDWFEPYAHNIKVIGYGNHETSILKHTETDLIDRFVTLLNYRCKSQIQVGGYGGWILYQFYQNKKFRTTYKIKYFHGSGGGGPVTKGAINFNRMQTQIEGADAIWLGHVHESTEITYTVERINQNHVVQLRDILMIRTPTYKEEYNEGKSGWHIERGAPPKPLGGRWLQLNMIRNEHTQWVNAKSFKTD